MDKNLDIGDNFKELRGVTYARNAVFDIAKKLGFKFFIALDDDYTSFAYRFDKVYNYCHKPMHNLDDVLGSMLQFYIVSGATSLAMAQGGDFIGGKEGSPWANAVQLTRKCMNSFICSTDRPFKFVGRINEDVSTYVLLGSVGLLFFSLMQIGLNQHTTQENQGGLTEIYLDLGTYVKSFYTVMYHPSSVKIRCLFTANRRIHHRICWNNTAPKIVSETYKRQ